MKEHHLHLAIGVGSLWNRLHAGDRNRVDGDGCGSACRKVVVK